jgi:hypothetical protein
MSIAIELAAEAPVEKMIAEGGVNATTGVALAAGTFCMAATTLGFLMKSNEANKRFHYVAAAVTGIATMAYLLVPKWALRNIEIM